MRTEDDLRSMLDIVKERVKVTVPSGQECNIGQLQALLYALDEAQSWPHAMELAVQFVHEHNYYAHLS